MKTILIEEFGAVDQLKEKDMPMPTFKENQVLIEVYAFSINPVDWKRREGKVGGKLPMVLGGDVAGIVKEIGSEVKDLKPGDRVFANATRTYAEYTRARAEVTAKIPDNMSFEEAAAVPLVGQTAWEAVVEQGKIKDGDRVLIHAGAGGVGSTAIQIAKHFNAYIATTASKENAEFVKSIGASEHIDYKNEDFEEKLKDFDLVIDPIGGKTQEKSYSVLKPGGRLVSLVQEPDEEKLKEHGIEGVYFSMKPTGERLKKLAELMETNELIPIVSQTYPFTEEGVREAHKQSQSGHTRGKLVVKVK
ncbi:NADP-dependent oxidoreductase [Atopococcus tabaci]|uniref:NADP-dependent oxidoreductase n=1 Tax=Atopococcus tabaci TaxID=269774 RepID=UPI00240A4E94|nr:NADP-dependent oxidoreductase [Atopococcus tabaci]